jgi:DNA-binding winged helix-turn-helix (wHTH) protein/TolB-like protein/Tfp pilus assembly protein PilF
MSLEPQHFYRFGDFQLDPFERELRRNGTRVPLTPKALHLLSILVENHGHIVDKEKLIGEIWADSFVEDGNLAVNATILRKALDDDANAPTFIETIPRRGYRFIAEVRRVDEKDSNGEASRGENVGRFPDVAESTHTSSPSPLRLVRTATAPKLEVVADDVETEATVEPPRSRSEIGPTGLKPKAFVAVSLGILIVGALALGYYFYPAAQGKRSIAILPIKPIDAANRDELYELGIAESLILKLSSVKGLDVRPLSATRKYAAVEQDPLAAGSEQQVGYVLNSNYQLADGKIRITAQLFNVATGETEDTYKSEIGSGDIFAMQDSVAGEIGNKILARLGLQPSDYVTKRGTESEDAYRLYLRGKYLQEKRGLTNSVKALESLDEAIRLDPNYARAWALKSISHMVKLISSRSTSPEVEVQKATEAANKALQLDGNLSEAHGAVCEIKMTYEWDLAEAERSCKRAVELDPNSTLARQAYSRVLMTLGRFDEATAEAKAAIDLEPASLLNHRIYGCTIFEARRYDEAITVFKKTIELDPNSGTPIYFWLVEALQMKGSEAEAFEWFMKMKAVEKADESAQQAYRSAYERSGWRGVLEEQAARFDEGNAPYFGGVYANARLGRKDKAFEYLEKAFQRREWPFGYIRVEPRLDPLRDDPRFDAMVRRVERR